MSMTTKNFGNAKTNRDAADNGPKGAGTLITESEGEPSTNDAPGTQSPSWGEKDYTLTPAPSANTGASVSGPQSLHGNVILSAGGSK